MTLPPLNVATLETRYRAGEARALARAVTLAEAGLPQVRPLLRAAREQGIKKVEREFKETALETV